MNYKMPNKIVFNGGCILTNFGDYYSIANHDGVGYNPQILGSYLRTYPDRWQPIPDNLVVITTDTAEALKREIKGKMDKPICDYCGFYESQVDQHAENCFGVRILKGLEGL